MAAVSEQNDLVALANPGRERITIADLPVKTGWCFSDRSRNVRVEAFNAAPNFFQIALLKP